MMNKEDILLLVNYFEGKRVKDDDLGKIKTKLSLIKKQIEAQDTIQDIQKKLAEMDKIEEI